MGGSGAREAARVTGVRAGSGTRPREGGRADVGGGREARKAEAVSRERARRDGSLGEGGRPERVTGEGRRNGAERGRWQTA